MARCVHVLRLSFAHESRGVVIPDSLCVAKTLQDGVGLQQEVLHSLYLRHVRVDAGNVLHDHARIFGLPGTTLTCKIEITSFF